MSETGMCQQAANIIEMLALQKHLELHQNQDILFVLLNLLMDKKSSFFVSLPLLLLRLFGHKHLTRHSD